MAVEFLPTLIIPSFLALAEFINIAVDFSAAEKSIVPWFTASKSASSQEVRGAGAVGFLTPSAIRPIFSLAV